MAYNNRFAFVGKIVPGKKGLVEVIKGKYKKANMYLQVNKNNGNYAEIFGGHYEKIYAWTKGVDGERGEALEVAWADRLDESIVEMVADFKKFRTNFGEEKDFLAEIDFIEYLEEELPKHKDEMMYVSGNFEIQEWNGKFYKKYKPTFIGIAREDMVPGFTVTADIFFREDAWDDEDLAESGKVFVDGYIEQYSREFRANKMYPTKFIVDLTGMDVTDKDVKKRIDVLKRKFETDGVAHLPWKMNAFRGAQQAEVQLEDLTPEQQELIEFGFAELADFKQNVNGATVDELQLLKPLLKGKFADGAMEFDGDEEEFEAMLIGNAGKEAEEATQEVLDDLI